MACSRSGFRWHSQDVCEEGGIFAIVGPYRRRQDHEHRQAGRAICFGERPADAWGSSPRTAIRIGAQEHLLRFGRILGVPVQVAGTPETLRATLDQLADKKLILIDTAGFSLADGSMLENLERLTRHSPTIQTLLALPANLQTAALRQAIRTFDPLGLDGAIATKVDEATSLGGLLSAVIETSLAVCYVADGQRVPEDLKPASRFRAGFVSRAVSLARRFAEQSQQIQATNPGQNRPAGELHAITTEDRVASYG